MLAAVTGLAAVLHSSAVAFQTLKYLGIAFLLYLAWSMWRDDSEFVPVNQPAAPPGTWRIVGTAAAVRDEVTRRPGVVTWLRRTFAVSYVALAARMA